MRAFWVSEASRMDSRTLPDAAIGPTRTVPVPSVESIVTVPRPARRWSGPRTSRTSRMR
jgi:hypothetical protein